VLATNVHVFRSWKRAHGGERAQSSNYKGAKPADS
jgi:hypothetical protein